MDTTGLTTTRSRALAVHELTLGDLLDDVVPIVGVVFVAGPPVLVSGALTALVALMIIGALTLILTFVGVIAAAALVAWLVVAAVAAPYRLIRRRRTRREELPAARPLPPTPIAAHWAASAHA